MALLDRRLMKIHHSAFYGTPGIYQRDSAPDETFCSSVLVRGWSPFSNMYLTTLYVYSLSVCTFMMSKYVVYVRMK